MVANSSDFTQKAEAALLAYRRADGRQTNVSDLPRLIETLRLIGGLDPLPRRVCDLATFGAIDPALRNLFGVPYIVTTGNAGAVPANELIFCDENGVEACRFVHDMFDLAGPFPYPDDAFDLVVFTEVLEHLARDPMHTMAEINRILRLDGRLILSTPNCVSARCVMNGLCGEHPYNWPPYSRESSTDRHNREYTPREVRALISFSGFELVKFFCKDVYPKDSSTFAGLRRKAAAVFVSTIRGLLFGRDRAAGNGEMIFVVGRKVSGVTDRYPPFLYY